MDYGKVKVFGAIRHVKTYYLKKEYQNCIFKKKIYEECINVYVVLWANFQFNKSFLLEVYRSSYLRSCKL
jgi:hypothetical protein